MLRPGEAPPSTDPHSRGPTASQTHRVPQTRQTDLQDRRRGPSQVYTARAAVGERVVQEGASAVPGHQQTIGPDPLHRSDGAWSWAVSPPTRRAETETTEHQWKSQRAVGGSSCALLKRGLLRRARTRPYAGNYE